MYPAELVAPMSKDLTTAGFESLLTPEEVVAELENSTGTALLVVNSVCGCAAANARPGVKIALQNEKQPDKLFTVFAGVNTEATAKAREYLLPYPPSSPAIALFKDGRLVHFLERHHNQGRSAMMIAANVKADLNDCC